MTRGSTALSSSTAPRTDCSASMFCGGSRFRPGSEAAVGAMARGPRAALLPDDPDLERGADVGGQLDGDRVDPEGLDRLLDGDLPLVDREPLLLEGRGDVHR